MSFFSVICTICCLCMMSIVYFGLCFMLCYILCEVCFIIFGTRRSGCYVPILLAPAEGWGPFGPLGPFGPFWGPSAPSSEAEGAKEDILNLVSR